MDIKIVGAEPEPKNKEVTTPEQLSAPTLPQLLESQVAELVGLSDVAEIKRSQDKIQILIDYAKSQSKDHSPENIKWIIRSLELKLGTPPLAEKRINWLSRYAYLSMEKRKLDTELMSFEPL